MASPWWNDAKREYFKELCLDGDYDARLVRHRPTFPDLAYRMNMYYRRNDPSNPYTYINVWREIRRDPEFYGRRKKIFGFGGYLPR
jgi:hypothetical protein